MNHGSLFSGIGGFDLAAQWMGWENKFHCEWNEFGQKILKYYWPNAESYGDITKTDFTIWRGRIDIITGGFPCQPYSVAGKRKGKEDDRHLWPEMLRAIREIQPRYIVGENVPGLINWNGGLVFDEVQADMENEGYEVIPFILPACAINAPHRRERIWFIAHSSSIRWPKQVTNSRECKDEWEPNSLIQSCKQQITTNSNSSSKQRKYISKKGEGKFDRSNIGIRINNWANFPTKFPICSRNDGISSKLDGITFPKWRNESIKAYGNAIVPQVAYQIFKAIQEFENKYKT